MKNLEILANLLKKHGVNIEENGTDILCITFEDGSIFEITGNDLQIINMWE